VSSAVAAALMGHDYQARIFLTYAAQLRVPGSNIAKVGYEHDLIRAFDDVVVHYERPEIDEYYGDVEVDFFQVKYQVRQGAGFTWEALMDPAFINATSVSILQRLRDAVAEQAAIGKRARFILVAPRPIEGELRLLLNNAADAIDMGVLFDGTVQTPRAKVRTEWRKHLNLSSDEELQAVLSPLRIRQMRSLEELRHDVEMRLLQAGLRPWRSDERANRYDDLPKKLVQARLKELDRDRFESLMNQEQLIVGPPLVPGPPAKRLGIRTYMRYAEQMADETDDMCCLVEHFDGRAIRKSSLWEERVRPALEAFLARGAADAAAVDLHLATHPSLAFAAGWQFDLKAHVDVAPVQGREVWRPDLHAPRTGDLWQECVPERVGDAPDVVLAISVTHDVRADVERYLQDCLPEAGTFLHLVLRDQPGQGSVRDGTHAFRLAEAAMAAVLPHIGRGSARGQVHLFAAAPNGLMFFLGRMARRLGRVQLYEHDWEGHEAEAYVPSLRLG
jgi:hypothetical protein